MNPLLIGPLLEVGKAIFDRMWPDPAAQAEAQLKLAQLAQAGEFKELEATLQLALAQIEVNKADAQSTSNFRGGWRPFIGWVCGVGLAYAILLRPVANGVLTAFGHGAPMPELDSSTLMTLLGGMLGFGGLRTFEKLKGQP